MLSEALNILDGQGPHRFSAMQIAVDLIIYVVIGAIVYAFRHRIYENIKLLFTGIFLFQLINLGALVSARGDSMGEIPVNLEALIASHNGAFDGRHGREI